MKPTYRGAAKNPKPQAQVIKQAIKCFAMRMAGGGIKPGISIGQTDDYCYNVVEDSVPIHDLQATILNCLGVDHTKLTYKFQGRDFRLTDVAGKVVSKVLA